jgi:hypothetical protein
MPKSRINGRHDSDPARQRGQCGGENPGLQIRTAMPLRNKHEIEPGLLGAEHDLPGGFHL